MNIPVGVVNEISKPALTKVDEVLRTSPPERE